MSNYQDRIKPTDFGIQTYLGNIQAGGYQIPTFQRDVVWERGNVKMLWDSVYKFYPLGSILVWRTPLTLHSHRSIGGHVLTEQVNAAEHRYILDGQQRTTSLYSSIYGGKIEGQDSNPMVYIDLTIALDGPTDDMSYRDRFLFWDEIDDQNGALIRNKGRQKRFNEGTVVSLHDIIFDFGKLDSKLAGLPYDAPERVRLRTMQSILQNYRLSFIELHGIEVAEVCQIFERVNQAGKPLSIFDIVVAKTYRTADDANGTSGFYLRDLIQAFRESLGVSNYARLDDWTFLQMVAVCVRLHQQKTNGRATVLNITDKYLNELKASEIEAVWESAQAAMRKTLGFLDHVLSLNGPNLVPYRYVYMTLTGYYFENPAPSSALLQRYFWFSCFHRDDLLSNTTGLWQHIDRLRDGDGSSVFKEGFTLDRNSLRMAEYSTRGGLARAILAFYAHHHPRDWAEGHAPVLNNVYYTLTDRPNLHHIFPTDFVWKSNLETKYRVDSLLNIAYLPQITNLKISNKNPLDYLGAYVGTTPMEREAFLDVLKTHLIPTDIVEWQATQSELPPDALVRFVEQRLDLMIAALLKKLDGIPANVYDSAPPTLLPANAASESGVSTPSDDATPIEA
ncbi:DUF262 domain-containing protein [Burkholderia sp. Ac-20353]|uniref:GmrSD restriction endonuclease domain-containing protein n=1 Tax=Burkholderia sp. Ac-20353 TaxID=2703894 RepID=UPI00197C41BF|nr:DUF262 domain-containing protein [Burkholderia sp. Ac-20353]MBN3792655.1 DUF262 domain-containing protein [Burkholderia sp. Ac-20353]